MNPGVLSVRNNRVVFVAMLFVLVGGLVAYRRMGRLEDPEFTIKEALIITPYPGASAQEVAKEVSNPIESACQQLGQLKRVDWESSRGMSVVTAVIQDRFHRDTIPQVWDELRRKVADVQPSLPPSVRGKSMVIDDFGDVYGIFLAITGEGYTQPELRRYAELLRRELLLAPNVKRVELFAEQQEVVFLEISRQRLAQLGINEEQIYRHLQARNVAAAGGRVRVGGQHLALDPKGEFRSAEDMLELVIGSDQTGRQLFLKDVATLERGDQDPPWRLLRYDGKPAVGLGISTVQGGNVVTMGAAVRRKLAELKRYQPVGVEIGEINFQPEAVTASTNEFVFNLGIKVGIEAGEDRLAVVRDMVAQNQWPLFGATAIGVIAFAAIGLSEDRPGEYCNSLFWVILISLSLSWVSSITVTPLLSYLMFRPAPITGAARPADPYSGRLFRAYRGRSKKEPFDDHVAEDG
jgi:multidrug efflux pump subunit AcrB